MVADLIARYRRAGLIDDAAFAQARAKTLHARGVARRAIAARLRAKGVGAAEIEAALAALADGETDAAEVDLAAARRTAQRRRLGPWRPAEQRAARRERDLAALARAGFPYPVAKAVIDGER